MLQKARVGCIQSEKLVLVRNVFFHPMGLISFYKYCSIERDQKDARQLPMVRAGCSMTLDKGIKLKIV